MIWSWKLTALAGAVVLAGGGLAATSLDKSVTLNVDGQTSVSTSYAGTVGDVLKANNIELGPRDLVFPSVDSPVSDGSTVQVQYSRKVTLLVDGKPTEFYTTATTLDGALATAEVRGLNGAAFSLSRSAGIGREGLTVDVRTPKQVKLKVGGKSVTLTTTAGTVADLLAERKLTVGFGESCTGGLVAHRLTNVPGCSTYYRGAINAYANDVKVGVLGVEDALLARHGAVSEEVAGAMADGARRVLGTDVAVGVTGIAGPDGGTAEKPVGTVCFGLAAAGAPTVTRRYQLWGNREWVKLLSSQIALDWVRRHLLGAPILEIGRRGAVNDALKKESVAPG